MMQPTATPSDSKPALTPQLRFPEFLEELGWKETLLNNVLIEHEEKNDGASEVHSVSVHKGVINQIEHLGRSFAAADRSNYNLAKPYDIIYTKSPTGDFPFGIVKQSRLPYNVIVSPLYGVFSPINRHLGYILDAYFESPIRTNNYLAPITQKGAKNTIQISNDTFLSKGLYLPPSEAECEKIAECLSTLDELIGAESQKLDALKAHKKGLMQQLFPREGETRPRLRFPEFQNVGDWVKTPFSELCDVKHGYPFESEFFSEEGAYVLLTPGNFYEEGGYRDRAEKQKFYTGDIPRDYVLEKGDMLVAMTEQAAGLLGSPLIVPASERFLHNQRLGLVVSKPGAPWATNFFFHVFNSQTVRKQIDASASGAKVRHTSPIKIGEVIVSIPNLLAEQRRIATCLSSLDELISAQSDLLSALRTHKQGLLQQLFPSPAAADV